LHLLAYQSYVYKNKLDTNVTISFQIFVSRTCPKIKSSLGLRQSARIYSLPIKTEFTIRSSQVLVLILIDLKCRL